MCAKLSAHVGERARHVQHDFVLDGVISCCYMPLLHLSLVCGLGGQAELNRSACRCVDWFCTLTSWTGMIRVFPEFPLFLSPG